MVVFFLDEKVLFCHLRGVIFSPRFVVFEFEDTMDFHTNLHFDLIFLRGCGGSKGGREPVVRGG